MGTIKQEKRKIMRFYPVLKSRKGNPIDSEEIEKEVEKICRDSGISVLYVPDSYIKGKQTELRDTDAAYLPEKRFPLKEKVLLQIERLNQHLKKIKKISFETEAIR